jgi:phage gp16-like protein
MAGPTNLRLLTDFFNKIGHKRTHAPQQNLNLFDHLVGEREAGAAHNRRAAWRHGGARGPNEMRRKSEAEAELLTAASGGPFRCLP